MPKPLAELKTTDVKVKVLGNAEERTITAVVSSSNRDRDYEFVDVPSLRLPLKGGGYVKASELDGTERLDIPMLLNHSFDVEDVIGSVRSAYLNDLGELVVVFGISKRAKAQDLMTLIDEGHLDNAFSITMSDYEYSEDTIYNAELIEISLVFRGSNKDARVLEVKSVLKGESKMSDNDKSKLAERKAELLKQLEELEKAETQDPAPEVPADAQADDTAQPEPIEPAEPTDPVVPAPEAPEVPEPVQVADDSEDENTNQDEEEPTMNEKSSASKQVVAPSDVAQPEVLATKKIDKDAIRKTYVEQIKAKLKGDKEALAKLNEKAMELSGVSTKAITFEDGANIFQSEVVSADIRQAYSNVGRVGSLVNRINIDGAEKWSQLNETAGVGFQPVGAGEEKQEDKPVWQKMSIEPKEHAMIVAWFDGMAKRTPLAVYNQIVAYIAKEYAKLEDKIILSFEGVTTAGGDEFAPTGLIPLLEATASGTDSRVVEMPDYSAAAVQAALGAGYGLVETDDTITLVANRQTWAKLATAVDTAGRNVFTVVGDQIAAGALGTFNVALSQEMGADQILVGAMGDYTLVTNGGLETLFSREATVGDLNLYTSDASAVRANVDIAGKPVTLDSFALITLAAAEA